MCNIHNQTITRTIGNLSTYLTITLTSNTGQQCYCKTLTEQINVARNPLFSLVPFFPSSPVFCKVVFLSVQK